jgi:hypothetical protein
VALHMYVAITPGFARVAAITQAENITAAREEVKAAGGDETVWGHITLDGPAADALAAIACVNGEQEGSVAHAIETLVAKAFLCGIMCGGGKEHSVTATVD